MHLLSTIERYLRHSGVTASRFGRDVLGDPGFVHALRRGREPRDTTVRRIAAYLELRQEWIGEPAMTDPVKAIARRIGRRCAPLAATGIHDRRSAPWRSLLFDGARHRIALSLSGERAEEALEALEEEIGDADFPIAGHLVAELRVVGVVRTGADMLVTLDALTIEAGWREI